VGGGGGGGGGGEEEGNVGTELLPRVLPFLYN